MMISYFAKAMFPHLDTRKEFKQHTVHFEAGIYSADISVVTIDRTPAPVENYTQTIHGIVQGREGEPLVWANLITKGVRIPDLKIGSHVASRDFDMPVNLAIDYRHNENNMTATVYHIQRRMQ